MIKHGRHRNHGAIYNAIGPEALDGAAQRLWWPRSLVDRSRVCRCRSSSFLPGSRSWGSAPRPRRHRETCGPRAFDMTTGDVARLANGARRLIDVAKECLT